MKKKKLKAMKAAAEQLKAGNHAVLEKITGEELLQENPAAVDGKGQPIQKGIIYRRPKHIQVNNYRRIKKFFKDPANRSELKGIK